MKRNPSEAEFHQVFERITDAYVALDKNWRYTYLNAKAAQFFGRRPEDLIGKHIWTEFPEAIEHAFHRAYEKAMAEQKPVFLEEYYPPYEAWFENRIYPSPDGLTIYFHDVSERKRNEEKLRHSQQMLDEAQQVAHLGSWEWRIGSEKIEWSRELFRIYGLEPADAAGFHEFLSLIHPEDRDRVQAIIEGALANHQPFYLEERIVHPDGRIRILDSRGEVLTDPEGQADRMIGVCQDVTDRKRAEQMDAGQRDILAGIAAQKPLVENLERIARLHEELNPGALCSLLLMDADGQHVLHGAAPSLPAEFNRAIHGLEIGDEHGSCGTAAWRRERVVVADIANHRYWTNYKAIALKHGLRACWSTPVLDSNGQVLGTFAVYFRELRAPDIGELDSIDKMLTITAIAIESARLNERLRVRDRFFEMSSEVFCIFDPKLQRLVQINPSFSRVTGYSSAEATSRHYLEFIHPEDRKRVAENTVAMLSSEDGRLHEFVNRIQCADGQHRWLAWEWVAEPDGLVYGVGHDITERRRVEAELAYASSHDAVTGMSHHLVLERALASLLEDASKPVWILFVGLDRFQAINESMGHGIGDEVLQRVAERLQQAVGEAGHIARFAGDEFVVAGTLNRASALELAERLRAAVALPIESGDYRLLLTASIGISHSPDHGQSAQELLRRAEAAMTRAKRQGRDMICEFSVEQMQDIEDRLILGRHLRGAIRRGELELHYQPQHHAVDHVLSGFEALLRWHSHALGQVPPARFIPIAETLGLMPEIGEWVLDEACRQASVWLDRGHRDFNIAVNISAQQLQRPGLVELVRDALHKHAVPPEVLSIELTESSLMENVVRIQGTLAELKALGTKLSLDDFGTGYSSLAYLKQFPIDKLKIDQSFVRGLPDDADDAAIARTIVAMAHQLRMVVSAEGVETKEQAAFLNGIGCDELQGYHLGHPVAADAAEALFPH
jgi:diguanylate cyclase (GGDEF)-like protein/PAS domain S-box-containing protein